MSEPANPRESESPAPTQGEKQLAPSEQENRKAPVVWPRDMNAPPPSDPIWGSDPKALRHA